MIKQLLQLDTREVEIDDDFAYLLNDIETFAIRFMGSVMTNDVKIKSLLDTKLKLVNRHKRNK